MQFIGRYTSITNIGGGMMEMSFRLWNNSKQTGPAPLQGAF